MEVLNIFQVIQGKDFNILAIIESLQVSFEGNDNFIWELVENLMSQNCHKLIYYQRGLKAMNKVVN